jgi:HAMP domain-containing protein
MTSPSKYTIQLLEGIHDDAQRHDLAHDAARLLGTNAEQLEQLLARGVGARIARAGSEKRAEHVAGLLRSVGVSVEVVAPQDLEEEGISEVQHSESPAPMAEASLENAFEPTSFESPALETPTFETSPFKTGSSDSDHLNTEAQAEGTEAAAEEAGSTWWLPNASQAPEQTDGGALDAFVAAASTAEVDPFDSVIGAASSTSEDAMITSSVNDPFSTLLPSDSSASWTNPNDQPSAPWLNASALGANASAVPFDAVEPFSASNDSLSTPSVNDSFSSSIANDPFASAIVEHYSPVTPASSDPFANDPFAVPANTGSYGASGGSDPFGPADDNDPFGPVGGNDLFGAPGSNDLFGAPGGNDPFGAPGGNDPFGPVSDTHSPTSSTATVIRNDPFAAPMGAARDPFAPVSDPFAAPNGDTFAPVISLTSTSELPPQAKAARDRAPRRSSIQTKTIVALIVPMLLVVAGVVGFLSYQLPTTITTLLKARATAVAAVTAESLRPTFDRGDVTQDSIYLLSGLAEGALLNVPYGAFFMIEHESREVRNVATDTDLSSEGLTKYFTSRVKALDSGEDKSLPNGEVITVDGKQYIAAARQFSSISRMGHGRGYIFVGLKMDPISEALRNTLIPIFVAIGITLLLALAIGTGLARSLLRPIIAATQQANRISLGDLDRTVPNAGNDEIGDLLTALEQMRISLKSMVARLRRDRA